MRTIPASLIATALATGVMAQPAGTTLTMTCEQARQIVASEGAVVLRTGPTTYDRYVRDSRFCERFTTTRPAWIRTADTPQCPVGAICRPAEIESGR